MDGLRRYDDLFSRLLFDRRLRDQVRAGDWSAMGEAADAFTSVDLDRLEKLAAQIRDGLIRGQLGELGVGEAFPGTIAALGGGAEDVAERFLAAHGEGPQVDGTGRQAGVSMLESFYRWAEGQLAERPDDLRAAQHEFAVAMIATLARTPSPGFLVRWPFVRRGARGWCCVLDARRPLADPDEAPDHPVVYVGAPGRYVGEPVPLTLAAVALEDAEQAPPWAVRHLAALDPAALDAARAALAALGRS